MTPPRGTLPVTPRRTSSLQVLCLHPGLGHCAEFHECFVALIAGFNNTTVFDVDVVLAWSDVVFATSFFQAAFAARRASTMSFAD